MAQFQFNARSVQPATADGGYTPLPLGEHPMVITDSEVKQNQAGNGGYINFTVSIIDGPNKGAVGNWICNVFNSSETAANIARRQLSSLCYAVGVFDVNDTAQLHSKPFIGIVKPNPTEKNKDNTQISGIKDIQGNDPGKMGTAQAPAQAQQPPAFAAPQQPAAASNGAGWQGGSQQPAAQPPAASQTPAWASNGQVAAPAPVSAPAQWQPGAQQATSAPPWQK